MSSVKIPTHSQAHQEPQIKHNILYEKKTSLRNKKKTIAVKLTIFSF